MKHNEKCFELGKPIFERKKIMTTQSPKNKQEKQKQQQKQQQQIKIKRWK